MSLILFLWGMLFSSHQVLASCPASYSESHGRFKREVEWVCEKDQKKRLTYDQEGRLLEKDHFDSSSSRPYRRDVYHSRFGTLGKYHFSYLSEEEHHYKLSEIKVETFDGATSTHSVSLSPQEVLSSGSTLEPKVLIVDSGFNLTHPDLKFKHYRNPEEILDGLDNDHDGFVDNLTSYTGLQGRGGSINYSFNHNQAIQLPGFGPPLSHGAFVASVAMKGIEHTSFLGVGGDIQSEVLLYKVLELIQRYQVRFTNMSFGFGDKSGITEPGSVEALEGIILASQRTLHVVAAGNASVNFDTQSYSEYPACIRWSNKITVGALDTAELKEESFEDYKPAFFSNLGARCVDVMAPGVDVKGAGLGVLNTQASGTSVASPYVLNLLLKIHQRLPDLSALDYKRILVETAYVPEQKFPVKSGGLVYERRALWVADQVSQGKDLDQSLLDSLERVTPKTRF